MYAPKDFAAKNAIFHSPKGANFVKNFAQIPNFTSFSPSENEVLSAVYNCYCC